MNTWSFTFPWPCYLGKYNARMHEETARSEKLLKGAVLILDECLRVSPGVKQAYDGAVI